MHATTSSIALSPCSSCPLLICPKAWAIWGQCSDICCGYLTKAYHQNLPVLLRVGEKEQFTRNADLSGRGVVYFIQKPGGPPIWRPPGWKFGFVLLYFETEVFKKVSQRNFS